MPELTFILAGGGTGGHLYPGIAVAHALRVRRPEARIHFLTTTRPLDRSLLEPTPFAQTPQPVRPVPGNPLRLPAFALAWARSVAHAKAICRAERPAAVLGLGGYAAGPAVVAAAKLGIRCAILNPDAIPGRANRYLARRCDRVVLQWEQTRAHLPAGSRAETWGCPIRAAFSSADRAAGRRHFSLDPDRPVLLVTGASQGARTVNEAVTRIWPAFAAAHPEWQLLHLAGAADEAAVRQAYDDAKTPAHVLAFTHEMPLALAAADAAISRAGASTLAELTALGLPSILLPYPYHKDRHQHANAEVLVAAGAAICIEDTGDAGLTAPALRNALDLIADARRRAEMSAAARTLARPDAAERVADWLIDAS